MTFANDCANCSFFSKTDAQRKKNFAFRSEKIVLKFYEQKSYKMLSVQFKRLKVQIKFVTKSISFRSQDLGSKLFLI